MKNILFIKESKGTYRGGIEGKILSLAGEFVKSDEIQPVLVTSDSNSLFAEEFRNLGLMVYALDMDHVLDFRKILKILDLIVRRHNIGLIQTHAFRESLIARIYRRKRRSINHVFRIHTHIQGSTIHPLQKALYYILDRCTSKWVDHFVVISELLKQELILKTKISSEKISVVYNGIPLMGPPDVLPEGNAVLGPSMAIIGEIENRKQQHIAVEALRILKMNELSINLNLIGRGEGKYFEKLVELVDDYGLNNQVFIHGQVQPADIYDLIRDVPVILLPSLYEGVPTSIIEAMSVRKIVVTTPVGATEELVQNRVNGFLHKPGDSKELADILTEIYSAPGNAFNSIRSEGFKTYQGKFTLAKMMDGFLKVYRSLN